MGNFYVNFTVRHGDPEAVAAALAGRSAFVTPAQGGCVVVADEECERSGEGLDELAAELSRVLRCPVLAVMNHDDDILQYVLCERGEVTDRYDSFPNYFDEESDEDEEDDEAFVPDGGDAKRLCAAFGCQDHGAVERVLRVSPLAEDGYAFAVERHEALAGALGIPTFAAGFGFGYAAEGDLNDDIDPAALISVR